MTEPRPPHRGDCDREAEDVRKTCDREAEDVRTTNTFEMQQNILLEKLLSYSEHHTKIQVFDDRRGEQLTLDKSLFDALILRS